MPSRLSRSLATAHPAVLTTYCTVAAFSTYFCMYAFRKPFSAATYQGEQLWNLEYKVVLVITQVFGYALSKFIGIKVISEMTPNRRAVMILVLIGIAQAALLLFAVIPPPYNFWCLFFNGLPLGMVFGLVLGFLEGRKVTEAMAAGLCASFIVASGIVKAVGRTLIQNWGVSDYWMPFLTGLLFALPLLFFVWMLKQVPPPSPADIAHRGEREPMSRRDRRDFSRKYRLGLILLVTTFVLLTILRSLRDDFMVEIWQAFGIDKPENFFYTETTIALIVVLLTGAAIAIRNNWWAFATSVAASIGGFALVVVGIVGCRQGWLVGFPFMVVVGLGLYVPYVIFHTTVFERLIAVARDKSNIGYLMYLADSAGYLSYVGVLLLTDFWLTGRQDQYLDIFLLFSLGASLVSVMLLLISLVYFRHRMPTHA